MEFLFIWIDQSYSLHNFEKVQKVQEKLSVWVGLLFGMEYVYPFESI